MNVRTTGRRAIALGAIGALVSCGEGKSGETPRDEDSSGPNNGSCEVPDRGSSKDTDSSRAPDTRADADSTSRERPTPSGDVEGTSVDDSGSTRGPSNDGTSEGDGETTKVPDGCQTMPPAPLPKISCKAADGGGTATVASPELQTTLSDRWHESWLASPAVADLDGDGNNEIIVARADVVLIWSASGQLVHKFDVPGRVWASPVVGDLIRSEPGLEIAVASRGEVFLWTAKGELAPGFPIEWRDELRSLAAADIDGKGDPELVMVTTSDLDANGQTDIIYAIHTDGSKVNGFPPNTTGASGCDEACYVHGGFDQNLALGDLDGDGIADILVPQDNAYVSLHAGTGRAFDAASIFEDRTKFPGIRFLLDYKQAQQGWAENESTANQAHFTNTAPAIADVLGTGQPKLVMLSSVQNVNQSDRERGVALWVVNADGTRPEKWVKPFHAPDFIDGLWDFGDNLVAATNQVTVVDLDPEAPGLEMVFAGFDGKIHAVSAANEELWATVYTTKEQVLTGGLVAADLSGDGRPELIFNTYSSESGSGELVILGSNGAVLHRESLPDRGAMAVPTVADVDNDGQLEIIVNLKDAVDRERAVLVYTVPGSSDNCLPWPTGRGDFQRTGYVPAE